MNTNTKREENDDRYIDCLLPCRNIRTDSYRLDIQILRGLSIIGVLFFHFFPKMTPNGFLGVDIFFVLSGFLMSTILSKEERLILSSIVSFYFRRVKRILPLYYMVIGITASLGTVFLSTPYLLNFTYALSFSLNIYLGNTRTAYFMTLDSGGSDLFLHSWSLCVEIQFYLIVPILFFIYSNIFHNSPFLCIPLSLFIIFCSFSFSFYQLIFVTQETVYFYHPLSRCWIFAIGILAHQLEQLKTDKSSNPSANSIVPNYLLSPILILTLFLPYSLTGYQLVIRPFVVLISGWILYKGNCFSQENQSISILKYTGDISFVLYLIHWPVLVFSSYYEIDSCLAVILSIIISICVHHGIEKKKMKLSAQTVIYILFLLLLWCILSALSWKNVHGYFIENVDLANSNLELLKVHDIYKQEDGVYLTTLKHSLEPPFGMVEYPNGTGSSNILVVGNSYATQQIGVIRKIIGENYGRLLMYSAPSNQVLYNMSKANSQATFELVEHIKPDILIVLKRYNRKERGSITVNDVILNEYKVNIGILQRNAKHILLESPQFFDQRNFLNKFITRLERGQPIEEMNMKLQTALNGVHNVWLRINQTLEICTNCVIIHSDTPFVDEEKRIVRTYDNRTQLSFIDNTIHLTEVGLQMLEESYSKKLLPILENVGKTIE